MEGPEVARVNPREFAQELGRLIEEYEALAWIGLVLGVAGAFVPPSAGVPFLRGLSIALAGVAIGALLMAWLVRFRTDFRIRRCEKTYRFKGDRGETCHLIETSAWTALKDAEFVRFSVISGDGTFTADRIRYRHLGRKGQREQGWITLKDDSVNQLRTSHGDTEVLLRVPAPLKKKDWFEIEWKQTAKDAFPKEAEAVGKHVLYPIDSLTFELTFARGTVTDVAGYEEGAWARKDHVPLTPSDSDGQTEVYQHEVRKAKPGHDHAVSWTWN